MSLPPLTKETVSKFASLPFVKRSLANPYHPHSVLSFWFGFDTQDSEAKIKLNDGSFVSTMIPFWFNKNKDFDALCQPFIPVLRDAGKNQLKYIHKDDDNDGIDYWETIEGQMSRILLCDQFSRNCFRGTNEAFDYDEEAMRLAKNLAKLALASSQSSNVCLPVLSWFQHFFQGKNENNDIFQVPGPFAFFITTVLQHSENLDDHVILYQMLDWGEMKAPQLDWKITRIVSIQHTDVVKKFGHYPHRNKLKGRDTTKEEEEWLQSDDVPMWAKSQS